VKTNFVIRFLDISFFDISDMHEKFGYISLPSDRPLRGIHHYTVLEPSQLCRSKAYKTGYINYINSRYYLTNWLRLLADRVLTNCPHSPRSHLGFGSVGGPWVRSYPSPIHHQGRPPPDPVCPASPTSCSACVLPLGCSMLTGPALSRSHTCCS
jgi:hypothetical protein